MQTDRPSKVIFRIPSTSTHLSALLAVRNASIVRLFLFLVLIFVYILYLSFESCSCSVIEVLLLYSLSAFLCITIRAKFPLTFAIPTSVTTLHHIFHFRLRSTISRFFPICIKNRHLRGFPRMTQHTHTKQCTYLSTYAHSQFLPILGPNRRAHTSRFIHTSLFPRLLVLTKSADLIQNTQIVRTNVHLTIPYLSYIPHSSQKSPFLLSPVFRVEYTHILFYLNV